MPAKIVKPLVSLQFEGYGVIVPCKLKNQAYRNLVTGGF